jgi:hypothetical protein
MRGHALGGTGCGWSTGASSDSGVVVCDGRPTLHTYDAADVGLMSPAIDGNGAMWVGAMAKNGVVEYNTRAGQARVRAAWRLTRCSVEGCRMWRERRNGPPLGCGAAYRRRAYWPQIRIGTTPAGRALAEHLTRRKGAGAGESADRATRERAPRHRPTFAADRHVLRLRPRW